MENKNNKLQNLSLSKCSIENSIFLDISASLKMNKSLIFLDLSNNLITGEALNDLFSPFN